MIKEIQWKDIPEPTREDIEMEAIFEEYEEEVKND
jgi:hypothetical protein